MAPHRYSLSPENFVTAFPFHVVVGPDLRILQFGSALHKVCERIDLGVPFLDLFELVRPTLDAVTWESLSADPGAVFLIRVADTEFQLRGQFVTETDTESLVFLAAPWVSSMEQLKGFGLKIQDFAAHDAAADFLFIIRSRELGLADAKKLADKLRKKTRILRDAKIAAEQASEAKSMFLANISHEIRTPMNGVLGMAELLLQGSLQPAETDYAKTIHSSATALLGIINDILDFSKIESGHEAIHSVSFSPGDLIRDVVQLFRGQAQSRDVALRLDVDPTTPKSLLGDAQKIRQVVANLVSNAVKFTHQGQVAVRVSATSETPDPAEGHRMVVTVQDTGAGIPEAAQQSIFEPFVQADGSITRTYGGTGLGLSIAQRFATIMGGSLTLQSSTASGSCFRLELPVQVHRDDPQQEPALPDPEPQVSTDATSAADAWPRGPEKATSPIQGGDPAEAPIRILVVEDNPVNRKVAQSMLGRLGYHTTLANNGVEALQVLAEETFDLVFMDYQMPVMDGLEATKEIRRREQNDDSGAHVPIIALTANGRDADRDACFDSGMDDFVTKPVRMDTLHDVVGRWGRRETSEQPSGPGERPSL